MPRTAARGIAGLSVAADSLSAIKHARVRVIRDATGPAVDHEVEGDHPAYGNNGARASDALPADTDLVLPDIKSWEPALYRKVTGGRGEIAPTVAFARRLALLGNEVWVRFVLVPGLTDGPDNIEGVAAFAASLGNVSRVDVLPFHKLGAAKWGAVGRTFPLAGTPVPTPEQVAAAREIFAGHGLYAV